MKDRKGTEMDQVLALLRSQPPFLSVYVPLDAAREDADDQLRIEWKHARRQLVDQGAPDARLTQAEASLEGPRPRHRGTIALVIDGEGRVHRRALPESVPDTIASFGPLPVAGPLVRFAQDHPPYLVVLVDRIGADILTVVDGSPVETDKVDGRTKPIHKPKPGGWSQRRYQQRAENTWEHNAVGVANEVAAAARSVGARIVVVAGDERMIVLLREHLPRDVGHLVRIAETGGRAEDGSDELLEREIDRILATAVAEDTAAELRRYADLRDSRSGSDTVADGPAATFAALREAIVATLLVHDDLDDAAPASVDADRTAGPADTRVAWFDPTAPTLVATDPATLRELGCEPLEGRLADVAMWAAAGIDADIRLVPLHGRDTPADGIGAFLRGRMTLAE